MLKEAVASLGWRAAGGVRKAGEAGEAGLAGDREPAPAAGYACFDAADPAAVSAALVELPERVDVLVNNAGGNTGFDRPAPRRTSRQR